RLAADVALRVAAERQVKAPERWDESLIVVLESHYNNAERPAADVAVVALTAKPILEAAGLVDHAREAVTLSALRGQELDAAADLRQGNFRHGDGRFTGWHGL